MPPNRKTELSAEDLPTLSVQQHLKRLASRNTVAPTAVEAHDSTASYWEWPADAQIQGLQKIHDLLSAEHLEQNLIQDAVGREHSNTGCESPKPTAGCDENDSYWYMPSAEPTAKEVPAAVLKYLHLQQQQQQTKEAIHRPRSYWDYPAADVYQAACTDRVLEGQRARKLTSTARIEANLLTSATTSTSISTAPDAYWVF